MNRTQIDILNEFGDDVSRMADEIIELREEIDRLVRENDGLRDAS